MNEFPRVTIITPSYNQAAFLEETIRSVLDQGYPNLEYFVMDGGSKDGSVEIIQRYADRLAGWVSEKDSGQAEAINKGFSRATGEFVAWINSDDRYQPGSILAAVNALQADPALAFVYGNMLSIDGAGNVINVQKFADWGLEGIMRFRIIGQPAVFMRRAALEQAGYLDTRFHFMLDTHLWLRVAQFGGTRHVDEVWAAARYHEGAKNIAKAPEFGREAYEVLAWMQDQPGLKAMYIRSRTQIWAGAHLFNARYQLDGGRPRQALKSYLRCFLAQPSAVLPELNRVAYAAASLFIDPSRIRDWYLRRKAQRARRSGS